MQLLEEILAGVGCVIARTTCDHAQVVSEVQCFYTIEVRLEFNCCLLTNFIVVEISVRRRGDFGDGYCLVDMPKPFLCLQFLFKSWDIRYFKFKYFVVSCVKENIGVSLESDLF
jgi:hypothetical protein